MLNCVKAKLEREKKEVRLASEKKKRKKENKIFKEALMKEKANDDNSFHICEETCYSWDTCWTTFSSKEKACCEKTILQEEEGLVHPKNKNNDFFPKQNSFVLQIMYDSNNHHCHWCHPQTKSIDYIHGKL